jgi:hypothetical protein
LRLKRRRALSKRGANDCVEKVERILRVIKATSFAQRNERMMPVTGGWFAFEGPLV